MAMTVSTDLEWVRRDTGQAVWFWRLARGIREGFEEVRERLAASTEVPMEIRTGERVHLGEVG